MPQVNDPLEHSQPGSGLIEARPEWAVPLGRLGGTTISLSSTVFLAAAGLIAAIAATGSDGNTELAKAAGVGVSIWVGGWLIQAIAAVVACFVLGLRVRRLTIGVIGLEPPPHSWDPLRALAWAVLTWGGLWIAGGLIWFAAMEMAGAGQAGGASGVRPWTPPSLGFTEADSIVRAASWLLWIQALCQLFPLPGTLGRIMVVSTLYQAFEGTSPLDKLLLARRCLQGLAVVTGFVALGLIGTEFGGSLSHWVLLLILAGAVWISTRARDLREFIERFQLARAGLDGSDQGLMLSDRFQQWTNVRRCRKRLIETAREERQEAIDAARLDAILERLCREGLESLSEEEQGVLKRVSERLQRVRQQEHR